MKSIRQRERALTKGAGTGDRDSCIGDFASFIARLGVAVVLGLIVLAGPASAISESETRVRLKLTILDSPVVRDTIQVVEVHEWTDSEEVTTGFPSFVTTETSTSYDPTTRTLTVDAYFVGAALFTGGDETALASGMARIAGYLELLNPTSLGWFVEVKLEGFFEFSGHVNSDLAEVASTLFRAGFSGDDFEGLPPSSVVPEIRTSTMDPGIDTDFDLVTTTLILGVEETYMILLPPSRLVEGPVTYIETYNLGALAQAGGQNLSVDDGSSPRILGEIPPPPPFIEANEVRLPLQVRVDLKPESSPNCINPRSRGKIPVAILGSADFDVTPINPISLEFMGLSVNLKKNGTPHCSIADVSGDFSAPEGAPDGWPDLLCHFVNDPQAWEIFGDVARMRGALYDGTPLSGGDLVCVVPPGG